MTFSCWKCGKRIEYPAGSRVPRADACPQCHADLHCCLNCRFYDPGKHNQCAETQAEWVRDKEAANYCEYFWPNPLVMAQNTPSGAKMKFNNLFKA